MSAPTQKGTALVRKPAPTFTNHIAVADSWRETDTSEIDSTTNEDGEVINVAFADPGFDAAGDLVVKSGAGPVIKGDMLAATYPSLTGVAAESDDDLFTLANHGLLTGEALLYVSGTGFTGITTSTTYYVIRVSSSTFKLASSLANAGAGTAIDITVDGSAGVFTPTRNYLVMGVENSQYGGKVLKQSVQLMFKSKLSTVLS